jgi:hypothetical protein
MKESNYTIDHATPEDIKEDYTGKPYFFAVFGILILAAVIIAGTYICIFVINLFAK